MCLATHAIIGYECHTKDTGKGDKHLTSFKMNLALTALRFLLPIIYEYN